MNQRERMETEYLWFQLNTLEVDNPHLDRALPNFEQLVTCQCWKQYRVFVNGDNPMADKVMPDVNCPNCGLPASEFYSLACHSGDVFNAVMMRGIR